MRLSLKQHLEQQAAPDLALAVSAVGSAAIQIEQRIRSAALTDALGAVGKVNVQGEEQQKLDVLANGILLSALRESRAVAGAVSEENEDPVVFPDSDSLPLIAIFDPLDGSSNIDVNVNVGTIVSLVRRTTHVGGSALQPGNAQVAAIYVNYGPSTTLVYTVGNGVHSFVLAGPEFLLAQEHVHMPEQGPYYSVNESRIAEFPAAYRDYLGGLRDGSLLGQNYNLRYVGSFIADFHRTLLKGGVFLYPPTAKAPKGKLRLLYEANPLSWIAEQAGGAARNAHGRVLDQTPTELHERTALVIGGRREMGAFERFASSEIA